MSALDSVCKPMSYEVVFSPEALAHLPALEAYLAERFYPANAHRYIQRIIEACPRLGRVPQLGTSATIRRRICESEDLKAA